MVVRARSYACVLCADTRVVGLIITGGSVMGYFSTALVLLSGIFAIKSGKPDGTYQHAKISFGLLLTVAIIWIVEFAAVAGVLGFGASLLCSAFSFTVSNAQNQYPYHNGGNTAADVAGSCAGIMGLMWGGLVGVFCCCFWCCCFPCLYVQKKHVTLSAQMAV
jgi:hypothetical protein